MEGWIVAWRPIVQILLVFGIRIHGSWIQVQEFLDEFSLVRKKQSLDPVYLPDGSTGFSGSLRSQIGSSCQYVDEHVCRCAWAELIISRSCPSNVVRSSWAATPAPSICCQAPASSYRSHWPPSTSRRQPSDVSMSQRLVKQSHEVDSCLQMYVFKLSGLPVKFLKFESCP